jgi:hypothetical protein
MDESKIRIAMIGAGGMANSVHYPSLASFNDVEIAAVCDLNQERLNTTANTYKIEKRYENYVKMIEDTTPDGVYVIGPPHYMYDIWTWCLNQGLNLYIEKPMGLSIHQARSLAELAEKNTCITQVSFQRRSCPMVVMLREKCVESWTICLVEGANGMCNGATFNAFLAKHYYHWTGSTLEAYLSNTGVLLCQFCKGSSLMDGKSHWFFNV